MHYFLLVNDLVPVSAALQGTLQLGDRSPAGLSSSEPLPGSSGSSGSSIPWLQKDGKEKCLSNISRQVSRNAFIDVDFGVDSMTEIYLLGTHESQNNTKVGRPWHRLPGEIVAAPSLGCSNPIWMGLGTA